MIKNSGQIPTFRHYIERVVRLRRLSNKCERLLVYQARGPFPWRDDMRTLSDVLDDMHMDGAECGDEMINAICKLWDKYRAHCKYHQDHKLKASHEVMKDYQPPWYRLECWGRWFDNRGVQANQCPRETDWRSDNPILAIGDRVVIDNPAPGMISVPSTGLHRAARLQAA